MTKPFTGTIVRTDLGPNIELARTFHAPIADVWDCIIDPSRMNRWIGTWRGEPGTGKRVMFAMTAEGEGPESEVLIHRCVAPSHLDVETQFGEDSWRLVLDLAESDGTTTLTFRQPLANDAQAEIAGPGWEYYLDRLVAVHTGTDFAEWDEYYPAQSAAWQAMSSAAFGES